MKMYIFNLNTQVVKANLRNETQDEKEKKDKRKNIKRNKS